MFKTAAAAALSLTVAFGALAPAPAHAADQEDIAKILLGVGFAALIAKALHDQAEDRDKKATKLQCMCIATSPTVPSPRSSNSRRRARRSS